MKLNFQQDDDIQAKSAEPNRRRSGLMRARAQLSQAVGGVLSNSLGALSSWRPQSASSAPPATVAAPNQHANRLREILERDRALVSSQPPEPAPHAHAAAPTQEVLAPRGELIAQAIAESMFDLDDDETTEPAARAVQLEPTLAAASVTMVVPKAAGPSTVPATKLPAPNPAATLKPASVPVVCKEPIRTRTMAKLLASQGHRARALSIYDHLLAKNASDATLVAEAEALRNAQD